MAKHQWVTHEHCDEPGDCLYCDHGIAECAVCGLAEGCLTTDCPGVQSYSEYGDKVYNDELDYRDGRGWVQVGVKVDGPCPMLMCLESGPHVHAVCPDCKALNYGNMSCSTCQGEEGQKSRERYHARYRKQVAAMADQREAST